MWKKIINKGLVYRAILFSQRSKNLITDSCTHALDVFFARPAVVVSMFGFTGGTMGFLFTYSEAFLVFVLLLAFVFLWQLVFLPDAGAWRIRVILFILAFIFGLYCMTLISLQRQRSVDELASAVNMAQNDENYVYEGYIISVSLPDDNYKTYTLLWQNGVKVRFGSSRADLHYGQHVRISGSLSWVPPARNPGGFDQRDYYARQGIFLSLDTYDNCIYIQDDSSVIPGIFVRLEMAGLELRRNISSMWGKVLNAEAAALLSGMILGDTSDMSPELKTAFRMCSLSHLTAVSGANVAYFLVPLTALFQKLSGKRSVRHFLVFVFLIFFGFLTGWTSSVTRALFMSAGTVFSSMLMKRHDPISAIFLTSGILMFNNPFTAVDLGFLLSFSATLSLILFSEKMASFLRFFPGNETLTQSAACLICTQLGMLPWLVVLSGKESVLLFMTNLAGTFLSEAISMLCLPLSGCLFAAGVFPFILPAVRVLFLPLAGLLYLLMKLAYLSSDQAIFALRLCTVQPLLLFSISVLSVSLLLPKGFVSRNLRRIMCFFLIIGTGLQIYTYINRPIGTVIFADVGQGDGALVLLDNGKSILIDGGDKGIAENVLIPLLNYYGIREPDITILTHLHRDHGTGILDLVKAGRISSIYTPCITPNKELAELFLLQEDNRVDLHSIGKDDKIVLSDSAVMYILSPESINDNGGNEDSAVVLLSIGDAGILFMGDAGAATEHELLLQQQSMSILNSTADFLKAGHHGSKFSTTQDFLDALSLDAAVISVGENTYGHPTAAALDRLIAGSIDIFRTDQSGAIILQILENSYRIYEYCG